MDITYLGAGSVKLSGKSLNVVCDPYSEQMGLGRFTTKADVVTWSSLPLDGLSWSEVPGAIVFDSPGEYEVKGAMITGAPARLHIDEAGERGTVFSILVDGVNVVVTGNIAGKLDDRVVETLGNVDVLVVPVGGYGLTLDAASAAKIVGQLEPSYVVPVHYDDGKTTYPGPQDDVAAFLKEMGVNPEPESKLRVNAKEAPAETQVVVLARP